MKFTSITKRTGYDWCVFNLEVEQEGGITFTFDKEKSVKIGTEVLSVSPLKTNGVYYGCRLTDGYDRLVAQILLDSESENRLTLMYTEHYSKLDPYTNTYSSRINHAEVIKVLEKALLPL